jgi:Methyltransferase domain
MDFNTISDSSSSRPITFLSLRDPAGSLFDVDGHLIRIVNQNGLSQIEASLNSPTLRTLTEKGKFIETRQIEKEEESLLLRALHDRSPSFPIDMGRLYRHRRVPFVSFPHEWPPEMLHEAGRLTLDLAEKLLDEGLGLKDATPHNILFVGPNPIFVDVLSVEHRVGRDPLWRPYSQFARMFLNPLLVNKHFGLALGSLLPTHQDGLSSEEVYQLCTPLQKLKPGFLTLVTIPAWLSKGKGRPGAKVYDTRLMESDEQARFVLRNLFKLLRRQLKKVCPSTKRRTSAWCHYREKDLPYNDEQLREKEKVIRGVLEEFRPKRVLDVGCNDAYFSVLAAEGGAKVVAIDSDPTVVGRVWQRAKEENLDILPLVVNLSYPTPAIGWMNRECVSFLERAKGSFDAVLMLAVVHHMLVGDGIPLPEVVKLSALLTTDLLVMEYVGQADPMFQLLERGRDHSHFTLETFEKECGRYFTTVKKQLLPGSHRVLYVFRKKAAGCVTAKI